MNSLSFLRWNLDPAAAALWQLAGQQAFEGFVFRSSWIDIDSNWNPNLYSDLTNPCVRQGLQDIPPPIACIVGIERSSVSRMLQCAQNLQQFCRHWSLDGNEQPSALKPSTFLMGWFPKADHESIRILQELGFDLIVHNPSRLRTILRKIACYGQPLSSNANHSTSSSN